jgi:hypothetical protein
MYIACIPFWCFALQKFEQTIFYSFFELIIACAGGNRRLEFVLEYLAFQNMN